MPQRDANGNGSKRQSNCGRAANRPSSRGTRIGRAQQVTDVADTYRRLSDEDEAAALVLFESGHYRQAACFLIQAMEKTVQHGVFTQLPSVGSRESLDEFQERLRTHNLDDLLNVLLDVFGDVIGDDRVSRQINSQLEQHVVKSLRFHHLHNDVRYLRTHRSSGQRTLLQITSHDVERLRQTLKQLRSFVDGFQLLLASAKNNGSSQSPATSPPAARAEVTSSTWTFRF